MKIIDYNRKKRNTIKSNHWVQTGYIKHLRLTRINLRLIRLINITYLLVGLPGRHVEKKPHTLDLFPSSVREPKIECLDLYT